MLAAFDNTNAIVPSVTSKAARQSVFSQQRGGVTFGVRWGARGSAKNRSLLERYSAGTDGYRGVLTGWRGMCRSSLITKQLSSVRLATIIDCLFVKLDWLCLNRVHE
ncbi:hypothetical protein J3E68DRAFT_400705 [Trichoderma sp. SZMC 28012]